MLVTNYFQTCCYITPVQDQTNCFHKALKMTLKIQFPKNIYRILRCQFNKIVLQRQFPKLYETNSK